MALIFSGMGRQLYITEVMACPWTLVIILILMHVAIIFEALRILERLYSVLLVSSELLDMDLVFHFAQTFIGFSPTGFDGWWMHWITLFAAFL